ncbi:MAG: hypothetical protein WC391_08755 [Methanoregula sp.]|jgi:hypothetical protein
MKTLGRIVLGIITAGMLSCSTGTSLEGISGTKEETKTEQTTQVGDIEGRVVVPLVENNSWSWKGKEDVSILIDGKERGRSIANGLFYISDVEIGARELNAIYKKYFLSEDIGILVKKGEPNQISQNIELIPQSDEFKIVHGIIYNNSSKTSRYNGKLRLWVTSQLTTNVTNGVYAFQGSVDDQEIAADLGSKGLKRVKLFDKQNPSKEYWQIDLGNNWVAEQNGYVVE